MTAEYESIFNEVDDWATEKRHQIELTQGPRLSTIRLNRRDYDEALTEPPIPCGTTAGKTGQISDAVNI